MTRMMRRILGAVLAIWAALMAIGSIFAMLRTFFIIGLVIVAVIIVAWLVSRRRRRR